MSRTIVIFEGGHSGPWQVVRQSAWRGEGLQPVNRLRIVSPSGESMSNEGRWVLKGQVSNLRYAHRHEVTALRERQEGLGRPEARLAALIPIRKSAAWWDLAQDERRAIFEEQSRHTGIGLRYLPGVARQLFHARDLGETFDFLTWFEFAPEHAQAFDDLLGELRATVEWRFVEREAEIRLERDAH